VAYTWPDLQVCTIVFLVPVLEWMFHFHKNQTFKGHNKTRREKTEKAKDEHSAYDTEDRTL